jgi:hypothetical protein
MSQGEKESYLEKRRHIRVDYRVDAEIIFGDRIYRGMIENISESGIFKVAFPEKKWLRIYTVSPFALKYNLGIEIVNAPQEYREFVSQLIRSVEDPTQCAPN